jgi:hypothetical protein
MNDYKLVEWEMVPGVTVPMMEDSTGQLFGTNKTVANMLGITDSGVRDIYNDHKEEFDSVSVANTNVKEFMKENKSH